MNLTYEVVIWWSREDACFIAEVPELPGCKTDGETRAEAAANAEEAMALWIDTAREFGRDVPEPRERSVAA